MLNVKALEESPDTIVSHHAEFKQLGDIQRRGESGLFGRISIFI